eukprot:NODE_12036_length_1249_cov_7.531194.p1 GENE.NODE_12036_length_1249_cov_7.531194~~NODE_12036_length_1249_cov_7.531194.p1  ORF type:complete len:290 (-),score=47.21 NODE_12036_length_1249_cov_7.531194:154-1023(-)
MEDPGQASLLSRHQFRETIRRAAGGGVAGAGVAVVQVTSLMWLRTTVSYQYRYGVSATDAFSTLYRQGGVLRFYKGTVPAIVQLPVVRFFNISANAGVLALFDQTAAKELPIYTKTMVGSVLASVLRTSLVPIDMVKTLMQVEGSGAKQVLRAKYASGGIAVFYHGAVATGVANLLAHYPFFTVFNTLDAHLPHFTETPKKIGRNVVIGFCSSLASDALANSARVVKTVRQTSMTTSYVDIVRSILEKDGWAGLLGRGLQVRMVANALQGIIFAVLYRALEEKSLKMLS